MNRRLRDPPIILDLPQLVMAIQRSTERDDSLLKIVGNPLVVSHFSEDPNASRDGCPFA